MRTYDHSWEHDTEKDTEAIIRFDEREQAGVTQNYTYHVDRGEFDNELLHHAHRLGAMVNEGVRISDVNFQDGELPRVHYTVGGKETSSTARIVIDASGRKTFLGNKLKLRIKDPVFDQYAIHTWFANLDRSAWAKKQAQLDYIFIHFMPEANTWIWQIPITKDITSVGVVTQKKNVAKTKEERE